MRVTTDEDLVRRKVNFGKWASSGGIGILVSGLLISFMRREWWVPYASWAALLLGFVVSSYGSGELSKWARRRRADRILASVLRGLDDRYHLFNYILPAEHVLLTPKGLLVLRAKLNRGEVIYQGDRWRQPRGLLRWFREGMGFRGIGDPAREMQRDVERMRRFLASKLPDREVPVEGVVTFLHEQVELKLEEPTVSVLISREVAPYVRGWVKGKLLPRRVQRELERLFTSEFERAGKRARLPGFAGIIARLRRGR